jgi:hypothetical protein
MHSCHSHVHFFSFLFHCFLSLAQFMRYCKDQGSGAKVLAEFIDDVATFRVRKIDRFCYMPWRFPSYRGCGDFRVKFECGVIEALFWGGFLFSPLLVSKLKIARKINAAAVVTTSKNCSRLSLLVIRIQLSKWRKRIREVPRATRIHSSVMARKLIVLQLSAVCTEEMYTPNFNVDLHFSSNIQPFIRY